MIGFFVCPALTMASALLSFVRSLRLASLCRKAGEACLFSDITDRPHASQI